MRQLETRFLQKTGFFYMDSLDVETQHYLQKAYEDVVTEADKIRGPTA